jgi:DNA-binding MarR family transcriptional regulator
MGCAILGRAKESVLKNLPPGVAALFAMHEIHDALRRAFERDQRITNYTKTEKLLIFRLSEPLRMGELAQALHCLPSNVTALVDQLEAKGLVRREPSPADRRAKQLVLTEEGMQVRQSLAETAAEIFSEVTGLRGREIDELLTLFSRARKVAAEVE